MQSGLSFIETVIGATIFAFVAMSIYTTFERVIKTVRTAQARVDASALVDEQFEIARNLPYSNIGTVGGIPAGSLIPVQTLTRSGMKFIATTTVRDIDLPFDGTIAGTPNDLSPADNKLVEIDIACITCNMFRPMIMTTTIAPKDLEGSSTNGALFVKAIDSSGLPIQNALVHIYYPTTTPIDIYDVTSTSGMLQIIDAPPGNQAYQITVSKAGYSTEQTYSSAGPTTTSPVKPYATVAAQTVTQLTFPIDAVATLNVSSVTPSCTVVPNIGTQFVGAKLIGNEPVYKYKKWFSTGASGVMTLNNMEWDNYTITASSSSYELAGIVPLSPVQVVPGATQNIQLIMEPKLPPTLLITVKDSVTGLPVSGATVSINSAGATTTQITGRGFLSQTDWSGGQGQGDFIDPTKYSSSDANIDATGLPGSVRLQSFLGVYPPSGVLESSSFDTGSISNFYQFTSNPTNQPVPGTTTARFQLATNNSTSSSWTYLGPDGTAGTYYTSTLTDIAATNNGNRFLRYKMYLDTASSTKTPSVTDTQFTFTSSCVPPGQVLFQSLPTGSYNITVAKVGYSTSTDAVNVTAGSWQEKPIILGP